MILKAVSLLNVEMVRAWRNEYLCSLRTPYMLVMEMQEEFYKNVICNRLAKSRFWSVYELDQFIGMIGLENIEWENRVAEVSFMINPKHRKDTPSFQAFDFLLNLAFNHLNLEYVNIECYDCNINKDFWHSVAKTYNAKQSKLYNRKFYANKIYDSVYFNYTKGEYLKCQ